MQASSAFVTRGSTSGRAYVGIQKASHTKPMAPVAMKAHCQPKCTAMYGTARGARTAPTFEPELKMPVARARSFLGNHSATVLIAAGKFPASPAPRAARATPKPNAELARACPIAARLQTVSATE